MQSNTSLLWASASVWHVQLYDVRHNETQSSATAFNLWGKKSLRNLVVLNTPIFMVFKKTVATFEFEVLALLGNSWGLSGILCGNRDHATMAGLHQLSHFSALPGCSWYFVWLKVFHNLFLCNDSSLIAVVTWWSCHLFLGRLREWSSICCCWRWSSDNLPFIQSS